MDRQSCFMAGPSTADSPIRLVYIMGGGRSGSTLLDTILGNHPEVESVGELCNVSEHGWVDSRRCACGQQAPVCPFWSEVRRRWARLTGLDDQERYGRLVAELERHRLWLPRLAGQLRRRPPKISEYVEQTGGLYQAIRAVSGKSILVDSSKRRARALMLSTIPGIDLRVIHLVRDVRGVTWSKKKRLKDPAGVDTAAGRQHRPLWQTALLWNMHNLQSDWVRRQLPAQNSIRVRYEDCVTRPKAVLDEIGRFLEIDLGTVAETLVADGPMKVGHTIAGNRMRMASRVRLQADTQWTERLSAYEQWMCWAVSGWLMRRYGYTKHPQPDDRFGDGPATANGLPSCSRNQVEKVA